MTTDPIIYVVDDDADVRDSMRALLGSAGFRVKDYSSARAFLDDRDSRSGCLIADVQMPDMDGMELLEQIAIRGPGLPVIVMTGHGDVPLAVRAMKAGAVDFIEKPFAEAVLLQSIERALAVGQSARNRAEEAKAADALLALLTPREYQVLNQIVIGRSNKIAAFELGISHRTIEIHRAHIMDKMNARSLSDLVRIALASGSSALAIVKAA